MFGVVNMKKEGGAWRDMMSHHGTGNGHRGRNMSHDGEEKGKMFVGGLSWESTQESLQRYFGQYGEVIDCVVMKNTESGRSRGFGFVTFADPIKVDLVLKNGPHELDGRTIDPKACNPRSMQKQKRNGNWPKVFLGGLPSNLTETDLRNYFSRFGTVIEVVIMFDQEKKKSRGFGFLSFDSEDSVERAVSEHFVNINGKQVEIKKAEPRDSGKGSDGSDGQWGSPQDNHWGMASLGPHTMQGMNNGMGPGSMGPQLGPPMGPHSSHLTTQGMVQGHYQGWGTPPQTQGYAPQGYGAHQQSFQSWGAGGQIQQWGAPSYGSPGGQQYGSYGDPYSRAAPLNALVAGGPGAPSPNLGGGGGNPAGGKGSDFGGTWGGGGGQYSYGPSDGSFGGHARFGGDTAGGGHQQGRYGNDMNRIKAERSSPPMNGRAMYPF